MALAGLEQRTIDCGCVGVVAVDLPAKGAGIGNADQQHASAGYGRLLPGEPRQGEIGIAEITDEGAGMGTGDDLAAPLARLVLQRHGRPFRQVLHQPVAVVPLRGARTDEIHLVLVETDDREFGDDPPGVVGEIAQPQAADTRHAARDHLPQPVPRPVALQVEPGEPCEIENAHRVTHGEAFIADPRKPRTIAFPGLCRILGRVVAGKGKPVGALPSAIGPHLATHGPNPVVDRREALVAPGGPGVMREVHGILVAVDLDALGDGVVPVCVVGEAARVAGPHVPFGGALDHPLGEHLAGAARLGDAEGEDAGLEGVRHARHRTDQGIAVRRIGDRSVDGPADAALGEQRHPRHGVLDVPREAFEVLGVEHEGEVLGHGIVVARPSGPGSSSRKGRD